VPRLPIAPRADGGHGRTRTATGQALDLPPLPYWATWPFGPSGWTRTTTTRVKSPACSVDTTEGLELIPGVEPGRRPYQGRRLPLHQISVGANGGTRTRTSRLGRPVGSRYPTFALVRPTGIEPVPPRWRRGMLPPHPGRTRTGIAGPCDILQLSKTPLFRAWWAARDSNPTAPARGERGYGPSADHPHVPPVWRQRQDSNPDPRALEARMLPLHHAADVTSRLDRFRRQILPVIWRELSPSARPKQKRPSRGSPQKACFSMTAGPLGRVASLIKRATEVAIRPGFDHGSRHDGSDSRAGQIAWPR
jgi:hypothetical protein